MPQLNHYTCFSDNKLLSHVLASTQQDAFNYFVKLYKMEVFGIHHISPERVTFYAYGTSVGSIPNGVMRKTKHKEKYNTPTISRCI